MPHRCAVLAPADCGGLGHTASSTVRSGFMLEVGAMAQVLGTCAGSGDGRRRAVEEREREVILQQAKLRQLPVLVVMPGNEVSCLGLGLRI